MIALDASVLIAYLTPDDAHHTRALQVLTAELDGGLVINPLTLAEVLVAPTRSGLADRVLAVLADLEIDEAPFPPDSARKLAKLRADSGLRMPDCCVLLTAGETGGRLTTFDDRLARVAQARHFEVVQD